MAQATTTAARTHHSIYDCMEAGTFGDAAVCEMPSEGLRYFRSTCDVCMREAERAEYADTGYEAIPLHESVPRGLR